MHQVIERDESNIKQARIKGEAPAIRAFLIGKNK